MDRRDDMKGSVPSGGDLPSLETLDLIDRVARGEASDSERRHLAELAAADPVVREAMDDTRFVRAALATVPRATMPDAVLDRVWGVVDADQRDERADEAIESEAPLGWLESLRDLLRPAALIRVAVPAAAVLLLMWAQLGERTTDDGVDEGPDLADAVVEDAAGSGVAVVDSARGVSARDRDDGLPCELDLATIFKSLGVHRGDVAYDDATICAAAEELRLAMGMVGKAMDRTARVIEGETTGRLADSVRKGLEAGVGMSIEPDSSDEQGG